MTPLGRLISNRLDALAAVFEYDIGFSPFMLKSYFYAAVLKNRKVLSEKRAKFIVLVV